jgi:hypothetical protein
MKIQATTKLLLFTICTSLLYSCSQMLCGDIETTIVAPTDSIYEGDNIQLYGYSDEGSTKQSWSTPAGKLFLSDTLSLKNVDPSMNGKYVFKNVYNSCSSTKDYTLTVIPAVKGCVAENIVKMNNASFNLNYEGSESDYIGGNVIRFTINSQITLAVSFGTEFYKTNGRYSLTDYMSDSYSRYAAVDYYYFDYGIFDNVHYHSQYSSGNVYAHQKNDSLIFNFCNLKIYNYSNPDTLTLSATMKVALSDLSTN